MYFGKLSVAHKLLQMAYNISITETVHTTIITENGMNSKRQTFSSRPMC